MMQKIDTDALKTKIFELAFTGKLTNRDANDEPVVDLEKTIIEENKKLIKERKLKKDSINSSIYVDDENHYCEKNNKNESHNIDKEIEFIIPKSWSFVRLKQVCYLNGGKEETRKELPYLDVKTLRNQKEADFAKEGIVVQQNQKLILVDGENSGEILNVPYEGYMGSTFRILETNSNIDKDYLIYFIMFHKNTLKSQKRGTAIPHLNKEIFYNLILPLPPREEQQRIVNMINIFLFEIQKIEMAELELQELEKLAKRKILDLAVCGKLVSQNSDDEPPSDLLNRIKQEKEKLTKKGKIKKGKKDTTIYKGEDGHYYEKMGNNTTDITEEIPFEIPDKWFFVRQHDICWLDNGIKKKGEKLPYLQAPVIRGNAAPVDIDEGVVVDKGTKIILVDGENSGEVMDIPYKGYMGSTFKILLVSGEIYYPYLVYFFELNKNKYRNNKRGAAIPHLNKTLFQDLLCPIPPLEEQKRIVDKLDQIFEILN